MELRIPKPRINLDVLDISLLPFREKQSRNAEGRLETDASKRQSRNDIIECDLRISVGKVIERTRLEATDLKSP